MPASRDRGRLRIAGSGLLGLTLVVLLPASVLNAVSSVEAAIGVDPSSSLPDQPPLDPDAAIWEKPPLWPGTSAGKDELPPPSDDRGFDVLHYDLDLTIDVDGHAVRGQLATDLRSVRPALDRVVLDLVSGMTADSLQWEEPPEGPALPIAFTHEGDSLIAYLPTPLTVDRAGRLTITYHGQPALHGPYRAGLMWREYGDETPEPEDDVPVVASMDEPWSAHSWWPCKDHPGDKATVTFAITVPEPYTAVSNGTLQDETSVAPGWRRFVWQESYPISTYLISVAVSIYESREEICPGSQGPVLLTYHVFPPEVQTSQVDLARCCDMLNFLENLAGPYPFAGERYGQVEFVWGGAMEHQTATSLGRSFMAGTGRMEKLILHEFAHQWFGDMLTPAQWRDIWLNEGFARYCEALWLEHTEGRASMLDYMRRIGPLRHEQLFVGEGQLADPDPILPNNLVYDKGAWVLHMLRNDLGDDVFFDALRTYATSPELAYGNVTTADFLAKVSTTTGIDAAQVLDPWLYSDAVPVLSWNWHQRSFSVSPWNEVTLEVRQEQDELFDIVLPVRLASPAGDRTERAHLTQREQTFQWRLPAPIDSLTVDPEGWLLFRAAGSLPLRLRFLPPAPNPAGLDGATLSFQLRDATNLAVTVYDVRGQRRSRRELGLQPATGEGLDQWLWDGRDDDGRPLPAGVYWLEVKGGGLRAVHKITLVR